jgi:hypothetical protein
VEDREQRQRRAILVTAYACALLSFAITVAMAERLDGLGAFRQNNLLFKDDCRTGLAVFADGWSSSYNTLRHPNLHFFVGHPLRIATTALGVGAAHRLAVLVSPVVGALLVITLGYILVRLAVDLIDAVVLLGVATASFSHLLFSSIPTHFGLSGLAVMLLFLLFLCTTPSMSAIGHAAWLLLGFAATGVTTFNLASWAAFYGARLWTRGRSVAKTAAWTVAGAMVVLILTIVVHATLSILLNGESQLLGRRYFVPLLQNTLGYLRSDVGARAAQFPEAFVMTFAAGSVTKTPIVESPITVFPFVLILTRPLSWRVAWVVTCAAAAAVGSLGLVGYLRQREPGTITGLVFAQLVLCIALLLVYGDDTLFLYSQHWEPALLIAFTGVSRLDGRMHSVALTATAILLACTIVGSAVAWSSVFDALRASS